MSSESDLQKRSGVKTDVSDSDFFLRKSVQDKNLRILKRGKSRHFEEAEGPELLPLNPQTKWFDLVGEQVNEAELTGLPQNNFPVRYSVSSFNWAIRKIHRNIIAWKS